MSNKRIFHIIMSAIGLTTVFSFCLPMQKHYANGQHKKEALRVSHDLGENTLIAQDLLTTKIARSTSTSAGQSFEIGVSTGGSFYRDLRSNVGVIPINLDEYKEFYDKTFSKLTEEEKKQIQEDKEKKAADPDYEEVIGWETRRFDSTVYTIKDSGTRYVLPREIYRDVFFSFDITTLSYRLTNWSTSTLKEIVIPNCVTDISLDAFKGVANDVVFYLEATEEEAQEYQEGWNYGCTVNYGYDYMGNVTKKTYSLAYYTEQKFGHDNVNFFLGSYTEQHYLPVTVAYSYEGENAVHTYVFEDGLAYAAVGSLVGDVSVTLTIDIPTESGKFIDATTVQLHNLLPAKVEVINPDEPEENWEYRLKPGDQVDYENPGYSMPSKSYAFVYELDTFYLIRYKSLATLNGFTCLSLYFDIPNLTAAFQLVRNSFYVQYKELIEKGNIKMRLRLTSLSSSYVKVNYHYNGGIEWTEQRISTPVEYVKTPNAKNNIVSLLINNNKQGGGFSPDRISSISLQNLYITLDLYNVTTNTPVARSPYSIRFGHINVLEEGAKINVVNINMILIFVSLGYLALFAIGAIILFFVLKNKYKNDEFRRMKTKPYVKSSIITFIGTLILILEGIFIASRLGLFNSKIVSYNPADLYIIIFGIASILMIGYFGRNIYLAIKSGRERRRILRLKIGEDEVDDGTK